MWRIFFHRKTLAQVNPNGDFCINLFEFYPNNTNTLSRVGQESDAIYSVVDLVFSLSDYIGFELY